HDEPKRVIGEQWADDVIMRELLRRILGKHGVSLSDAQLESLVQAIKEGANSVQAAVDGPEQSISISPDMVERAMHELEEKMDTDAQQAITRAVDRLAPRILRSLYDALPEALREWHAAQLDFESRLRSRWKAGLDRLDMLITMAHESGE